MTDQREPTADEAAGMKWWNDLSEAERKKALAHAGTAVVAEGWAHHKAAARPPATKSPGVGDNRL